ncbi:hypothetical protein quinque_007973 [Culex quinquefasciatus]
MLPYLLLVLLASTAAERDPRCARYTRGAQARTLPHDTDCTKFYMCDIQGNALEMKCPKNTFFSVDSGICTFDDSACSGGGSAPVVKPMLPIINKPSLPTINNVNAAENSNKDHVASGVEINVVKPTLPIINVVPIVANDNQDRTAPQNSIGLLKPTLPIISNVPDNNNNKERAAALGPICRNKNNGVKFPLIEDCFSYVICIQQKASIFTCPDGLAYDAKGAKCSDSIKCEMPKPKPPPKPTLTRPEKPEVVQPQVPVNQTPGHPMLPPLNPILPMPELPVIQPQVPIYPKPDLPVVIPQAPIRPKPETPAFPPQAPILPLPELPVIKPQVPVNPKPNLPEVLPQVPTRPKPDHPVIPPQAPILPMPGLPVLPPQAPILPTPELPVIPPQAPILPMPELPVIPTDPPKDTISGPIFMPYSAPRLVQDSRCSDRSALNSSIMLPAVDDCTKFVVCVGSMAYEKQCPVGQHWSTERNYCDFIDRAKCLA